VNKKNKILFLVVFTALFVNLSLNPNGIISDVSADEPLNIVASISIVADFTSQIGLGIFTVDSIVTGSENPHIYEPTPSEIEKVATADLFVRLGLVGLEPWVDAVLLANPEVPVLNLVNPSMMRYDPLIEDNNPHVWMDPTKVAIMVEKITNEIITIDPSNNVTYTANRDSYLVELNNLMLLINLTKSDFQDMKVVVHHPSFMYLLDLLEIERIAAIEEHEGEEPSPEHLAEIIEKIESENVSLLLNQPQLDESQISEIARDTGLQIADLTPLLGVPDAEGLVQVQGKIIDNYITMIKYNLEALKNPHDPQKFGDLVTYWTLVGIGCSGILGTILLVVIVRVRKGKETI